MVAGKQVVFLVKGIFSASLTTDRFDSDRNRDSGALVEREDKLEEVTDELLEEVEEEGEGVGKWVLETGLIGNLLIFSRLAVMLGVLRDFCRAWDFF